MTQREVLTAPKLTHRHIGEDIHFLHQAQGKVWHVEGELTKLEVLPGVISAWVLVRADFVPRIYRQIYMHANESGSLLLVKFNFPLLKRIWINIP